ncbi:hypothetical protein V8C86DRAFT_2592058, partial [Haematococcus lacustris]
MSGVYLGPTPTPSDDDDDDDIDYDDDIPGDVDIGVFKLLPSLPFPACPAGAGPSGAGPSGPSLVALRAPVSLGPPTVTPPPGVLLSAPSGFQLLQADEAIAKAYQHSLVNPKTATTQRTMLKGTAAFFVDAEATKKYPDATDVPASFLPLIAEFVTHPFSTIPEQTQRMYDWVIGREMDLCTLFCAYAAHVRNTKSKSPDGLGVKFSSKSFVHRFNCLSSLLLLHHKELQMAGRGVAGFVRPQFLSQNHSVWGRLWNTIDGVTKLAARAGEISMVPRQAPTISPEAIEDAQPLLDTSTPEGLQNQFLLLIGVNGM